MGVFSSFLCVFGGFFCFSYYCKKINDNLDEEVIIVKIKRSDIVDENGNSINRPPQYTESEDNDYLNIERGCEEIPLLENEVTNEDLPQYFSNNNSGTNGNIITNNSETNENRERNENENINSINSSIYNTNVNNVSTVPTTTNIVYSNSLVDKSER